MVNSRVLLRVIAAGLVGSASISAACGGDESKPTATAAAQANVATAAQPGAPAAATTAASSASPAASAVSTVTAAATVAPPTSVATTAPATPASTPAPQLTSQPATPRASAVALTFRAFNTQFDKTVVHVPAGASVTATLQNDDAGVQHNLTFSLPGLPHGDTCTGPCAATQTFAASAAGSYFFLCTIHDMVGTFVVDP